MAGEDGLQWKSGEGGCPAGCGCRETVTHVVCGRCTCVPMSDAYRRRTVQLVRMVWLCLPKVKPTKSMPMNEWQCDCRRAVLGAMRAAQAWDSGEEPSSAEVRAFKMLLAGVLPRCAKVESETDERRRRAVAQEPSPYRKNSIL